MTRQPASTTRLHGGRRGLRSHSATSPVSPTERSRRESSTHGSREQFGAPLGALPAVQARLADAALATDGLQLVAWQAAAGEDSRAALAWAGGACREVTAHVQQVHGGVGFALEGGIHRYYRRAKSMQVWTDAVLRATA